MGKYIPRYIRENRIRRSNNTCEKNYDNNDIFVEPNYDRDADEFVERYHKAETVFFQKTGLTSVDVTFLLLAAAIQTLRWAFLSNDKYRFQNASDGDTVLQKFTKDTKFKTIEDIIKDPIPYDAIVKSERFKKNYPNLSTRLSGFNHRYMTLGHDPLLGLLFGTANIATGTVTVNDWGNLLPSYHVNSSGNQIDGKTTVTNVLKWTFDGGTQNPLALATAFLRQLLHMGTDIFTKQGLPLPIISSISPETSRFLMGENARIDFYSTIRSTMLAIYVNKIVEMLHRYFYNPARDGDDPLYRARTLKVISYSNILSSVLDIGYVISSEDYCRLDVGGIAVALWKVLNSRSEISRIKHDFISKYLDKCYEKEEFEINQQLTKYGYEF